MEGVRALRRRWVSNVRQDRLSDARHAAVRALRLAARGLDGLADAVVATDRWRPIWLGGIAHALGLVREAERAVGRLGQAHERPDVLVGEPQCHIPGCPCHGGGGGG